MLRLQASAGGAGWGLEARCAGHLADRAWLGARKGGGTDSAPRARQESEGTPEAAFIFTMKLSQLLVRSMPGVPSNSDDAWKEDEVSAPLPCQAVCVCARARAHQLQASAHGVSTWGWELTGTQHKVAPQAPPPTCPEHPGLRSHLGGDGTCLGRLAPSTLPRDPRACSMSFPTKHRADPRSEDHLVPKGSPHCLGVWGRQEVGSELSLATRIQQKHVLHKELLHLPPRQLPRAPTPLGDPRRSQTLPEAPTMPRSCPTGGHLVAPCHLLLPSSSPPTLTPWSLKPHPRFGCDTMAQRLYAHLVCTRQPDPLCHQAERWGSVESRVKILN